MSSITDNVAFAAQPTLKPSYKDLLTTTLVHINRKLSVLSSLYHVNLAILLLSAVIKHPEIRLLVIGIHLCIAAGTGLVLSFVPFDENNKLSTLTEELNLSEEMAKISRKLELEIEQSSKLEQRNEQLLRELDEQKKAVTPEDKGSTKTSWREYKITPTEMNALMEAFEKAHNSLQRPPSEAVDALVFSMVEWSGK